MKFFGSQNQKNSALYNGEGENRYFSFHCSLTISYPTTNTLAIIGAICECAKTACEGQAFIKRAEKRHERVTVQQKHSMVAVPP